MATEPYEALPGGRPAPDPAAATMPPQVGAPPGYDPLAPPPGAPDYDPMLDPSAVPLEGDPMLGQVGDPDELDDAPTRIEREEEIQGNLGAAPGGPDVPRVVIIGGNNRGKEYPLLMGDNCLGRGVDNNVILADIAVSRKHTLICYEAGSYVVRDLGSGNGTLLNSKRVDSHQLQDGDQLELGNTLLRFVSPVQPAPVAPANVGAISKLETVVTPRGMAEDMRMTADVPAQPLSANGTASVQQATRREAQGIKGLSRTMKLLIFGGGAVVVLFGLMIGIKVAVSGDPSTTTAGGGATKAASTRPPDEIAAQEFQEGTTEYRARHWEKARLHFLKVLKLAPSFDQAKHYADEATVEISAAGALDRAKNSLKARDYKTVRSELSKIPSTSTYASDARTLKQKVDDEQVAKLLEAAKTLKAAGDNDGAMGKIKEAHIVAPTNKEVLELQRQISGSTAVAVKRPATAHHRSQPRHRRTSPSPTARPRQPRTRPRSTPKSTPIKVRGGKAKLALNLYRQKQWGPAHKEAKAHASSLSGRRKGQADRLADAIHKVGMSWNRAEHMTKTSAKLKYYQLALKFDAKLPRKPHQRTLKKLIASTATKVATNAISRKKYSSAYAAVKLAERYGGSDPLVNKVKKSLEAKAMQLFTKGYTMRSSNKAQARRLWQQILRMVAPSSKAYQKAYMWLNNSTPTYQDEDED
jgi:pSer/pThr/pTyr-binding forkhead associated (FHA) protein/tetratricopeptide (TPR) repeat protein